MTQGAKLSAAEYEKKKTAIAGVIDFNDANNIKYSKIKLFKHFGISAQTGYTWFPVPSEGVGPRPGRPKVEKPLKDEYASTGLKRESSGDAPDGEDPRRKARASQPSIPSARNNPVHSDGRGRKRVKAVVGDQTEDMAFLSTPVPSSPPMTAAASSPPPPRQLLTPPKRKMAPPKGRRGPSEGKQGGRVEAVTGHNFEDVNDIEVCEV